MRAKRVIFWAFVGLCLFVVTNAASYFVRSDGYGLPGVQDGIIRVGCPFLMLEVGGFAHREYLSVTAAVGNLLVAALATGILAAIGYLTKRARRKNVQ